MMNFIVGAVIVLIITAAIVYVVRAKKQGAKCVGCPYSKDSSNCSCNH